jgi:hypothetical protein
LLHDMLHAAGCLRDFAENGSHDVGATTPAREAAA